MCQRTTYPMRTFLQFAMLMASFVTIAGCQPASLTADDIIPSVVTGDSSSKQFGGSVNVQAVVPEIASPMFYVPLSYWIDSEKVKTAIEKSVAQKGLFLRIVPTNADYALDVWIEQAAPSLNVFGECFMFDVTSVWRLTRVKDGCVLVCDYVKGHGASQAFAGVAQKQSVMRAVRDTIQKGLMMLSDGSTDHLAAISTYESVPRPGEVQK